MSTINAPLLTVLQAAGPAPGICGEIPQATSRARTDLRTGAISGSLVRRIEHTVRQQRLPMARGICQRLPGVRPAAGRGRRTAAAATHCPALAQADADRCNSGPADSLALY